MKRVGKIFFVGLAFLGSSVACAQNLSPINWYFGSASPSKGIRFNRTTQVPSLVTGQIPLGIGGSAVATHPATGDILFYTDGNTVYDITNATMVNGTGLSANPSSNQPAVVCAVPGQPDKYFIFTSTANFTAGGSIRYTVVDMTLPGNSPFPSTVPFGAVVAGKKNVLIPALAARSEGMIIVPHANGTDFWLITHQVSSQTYAYTLINAASFTAGTFGTVTMSVGAYPTTAANFSYYNKTKKLAVSPQDASTDALIITFDDLNGGFTFDRYILNSGIATAANQSVYDIEWDPKGQYLYFSRVGEPGINADVMQYDYLNPTNTLASVLTTPVFRSYGLQLAPDSSIYYLYQAAAGGPFLVDTFTKTDTIAAFVKRNTTPLGNGDFGGRQFPAFLPKGKINLTASFTTTSPTCQNTPITFFPTVSPNADSLHWKFGDGTDTTLWSPIHTYKTAQAAFTVSLTAYYQGDSVLASGTVNVTPFPLQLQLVQDTTACHCQLPKYGAACTMPPFSVKVKVTGGTATSYQWSNGEITDTLHPDSAGYYYVVVGDGSGCTAYAGVNVKEYGKQDQRQNIWYFGNHAGIDFNVSPPKALNNSNMFAPDGCAIVCDRNGQTIFYTNGSQVFDKTHTPLVSTHIGGDSTSTQSSLIFPVPGDETLFYIFTTQYINGTANEVRYSIFDLKQNNGLGLVTRSNVLLFSRSTERLTGNLHWLIAHEFGNNTFRAYPITAKGIGDPVYTGIGSDHSFQYPPNGQGYMKLGPRNDLAVALSTPGVSNVIEIFHFNDTTGVFSNYRKIDLNEPNGQVYGIEFSAGGNKLFATITNEGGPAPANNLFEYFFDSLARPHLRKPSPTSVPADLGAVQIAPNGQVFVAINDPADNGYLGTITANEDTTLVSAFKLKGFQLAAGTNSTLGLPNFRQMISNGFGGPDFTFSGVCKGDSTHFNGIPTDAIDKFQWFFGDGGSTPPDAPSAQAHLYAKAGTYTVSMRLTNRCGLDTTIFHKVTINLPPVPTNPPAIALCNGPVVLDANSLGLSGMTYLWTNGDTTRKVTIANPAFISVTVTDKNGCHATKQSIVADNRPVVDLGPDITVCQYVPNQGGASFPPLNAGNPGATYTWTVPVGVTASPAASPIQPVDITSPFVLTTPQIYGVTVTDPITTCQVSDQIIITVKSSPTLTFSGVNPAGACGAPTGSVTLTLNGPDNVLYQYAITGPAGLVQQGIDNPKAFTTGAIPGQIAGTYSAIVIDEISQCTSSKTIGLKDAGVTLTAPNLTTCSTSPINATTTVATPFNYVVVDQSGASVDTGGPVATAAFATNPLPAGSYVLQVTGSGCTATANVQITPLNPSINFFTTFNVCTSPNQTITASPAGGNTFAFTGPGIVSTAANVATINPGVGSFSYNVTATRAGFCPTTQVVPIIVPGPITPSFTSTTPCADQVTLTASPAIGNYRYNWFNGPTNVPGGQVTVVTTSGNYIVKIHDNVTGCDYSSSPPQQVDVVGVVDAGLTSTQACDDNKPFTLTATTSASGSVAYAWYLDKNLISGAAQPTLDATAEGLYEVDISKSVCVAKAQLQVSKAPLPAGILPDKAIICNDPENKDPNTSKVDLDPGSFSSYNWFKNQLSLNNTSRVYTADSEGLYVVDLTNSYGCTAPDQTRVENLCIPKIAAPNAFRPGSTIGENKVFKVYTFFITNDFQVFIYNRWGELVFQNDKRDFEWNGSFNNSGPLLPGGMYAYVIMYYSSFEPEKGVQEKHGGVVLLR